MSKWKLCRQTFGSEEFELSEGDEVTVGRGLNNTITLSSIVISRNHGLLKVKKDEITITDLKSSNGIYIGLKRIPPNIPYSISDAAVIGFGWTIGAPLAKILDSEKYVFKLIRCIAPLKNRIVFQSYIDLDEENDDDDDASETKINNPKVEVKSPVFETKLNLKRKLQTQSDINKPVQLLKNNDIINISDNDDDMISKNLKKKKIEDSNVLLTEHEIKSEEEDIQYEAFSVKQEYICDDDAIEISSDNDSESELFVRLSQSSPCKSYVHLDRSANKIDKQHENSSYSQLDDDDVMFVNNMGHTFDEDDFIDDIITIPPIPPQNEPSVEINICNLPDKPKDKVDGISTNIHTELKEKLSINSTSTEQPSIETVKKTQMIEALVKPVRRKSHHTHKDGKKPSTKENKTKNHSSSSSKSSITNNQKEERRRKLKEIASKTKNADIDNPDKKLASNSSKSVTNVKITTSNRGAFLTDNNIVTEKSTNNKDKDSTKRDNKKPSSSTNCKSSTSSKTDEIGKDIAKEVDKSNTESIRLEKPNHQKRDISQEKSGVSKEKEAQKVKDIAKKADKNNTESIRIDKPDHQKRDLSKEKSRGSKEKEAQKETVNKENLNSSKSLHNVPDSLANSLESQSSKPLSKVLPTPRKPKKQVRFSCTNEVFEFETEPGTRMRKTSSVKTRLLDTKKMPSFSLEKITLMKILRWNPQWLDEQKSNVEPPPILGHNNLPMAIFHRFDSHSQYVGLVGDLLLMEIWECLTQAFGRNYKQNMTFQLRVESLPTEAPQEKYFDICNLSANLSLLKSEEKNLPRVGEIMIIEFGPEDNRSRRFFFVHNVRCLPSPPNNKNSFFSLSLYVTFTDRVRLLRPGEVMIARTLAYINKELTLFDAMEYLSGSPLRNAILRPSQHDFISPCNIYADDMKTQWTINLNPSQKEAVARSVSAALGDRPSIQMIQGPPGTGKSNVICSIVMTYFYNAASKRHSNRGKILICATSNAAVDELVIRLLDRRQSLPKEERFRMVRVGRLEAMHSRARDVSSQQLAQRGAARDTHSHPGVDEEIAHLEAKINMWKSAEQEAKDPVRVAYCRGRIAEFSSRKAMFRSRKEDVPHERPVHSERRIIERANIIVTTLASAHNHKMRGLKGRIALCIIDEAGQAIEPEALIPLTLDVTRLTLVGDTQQLPGFICSQRAKQHGLGESLFARLSSCAEQWGGGVLLDQQYRMQAAIADYPNRAFYGARVRSVPPAPPPPALALPHYTLLAVASGDRGQGPTYANETEAWGVARVTAALAARLRGALSLAVITPYSAHRDMLRECLRRLQPSESSVEVNTVDSFQGQERDVVVVSLARSQGVGFLTDAGRMNVMLTRARHALFVCLNPLALVKNMQWQTLIDDAHKRNVYVTLPNKLCQPATSHTPAIPHEEVLGHIIK